MAVVLLSLTFTPASQVYADDLAHARERRAELQQRLDQAAQDIADIETRTAQISEQQTALEGELGRLQVVVDEASERIAVRVRALYKRGALNPMMVALSSGRPQEALDSAAMVKRLVAGDEVSTETAIVGQAQVDAVVLRLAEQQQAMSVEESRRQEISGQLQQDLEEAAALEQRLEEEERRRREAEERRRREEEARRKAEAQARQEREAAAANRATTSTGSSSGSSSSSSSSGSSSSGSSSSGSSSPPVSSAPAPTSGGSACPMASPRSFTDTWGAPRSGGRSHRGTDILGPYGQRVFALVSGTWDVQSYGNSAGNWAILKGDDGTDYWYLHLQSHVAGDGARVSAGQLVATNGDTGNAKGTAHIHFEQHPGGGSAINPYPMLKRICG